MSDLKIVKTGIRRPITRIEIRENISQGKRNKSFTFEATDTNKLYKYIFNKVSAKIVDTSLQGSITESPLKTIKRCSVHVYTAMTTGKRDKRDFGSFTCYGDFNIVVPIIEKLIAEGFNE